MQMGMTICPHAGLQTTMGVLTERPIGAAAAARPAGALAMPGLANARVKTRVVKRTLARLMKISFRARGDPSSRERLLPLEQMSTLDAFPPDPVSNRPSCRQLPGG